MGVVVLLLKTPRFNSEKGEFFLQNTLESQIMLKLSYYVESQIIQMEVDASKSMSKKLLQHGQLSQTFEGCLHNSSKANIIKGKIYSKNNLTLH